MSPHSETRLVSIQHGDYREGLQILASGQTDPYFGMKYSVDILENLINGNPHLIISLQAPSYSERRAGGELVGVPRPAIPRPIPARLADYLMARRIMKLIRDFRPTHVLLRTGVGPITTQILRYCRKHDCKTLVIFANFLFNDNPQSRRINRQTTKLLNHPFVFKVGNHKWPATQSVIDSGLDPAKAVAWDWPGQREAKDYPAKDLPSPPFELVYVGTLTEAKGVGDLIAAAAILHAGGLQFHLSIIGGGDAEPFRESMAKLPPGVVDFKGRLPNNEVFQAMRDAALVFVPSRHSFPEGLPLTLTEGLASRTPLVVSDHPVMVRAFKDGQGLRLFRASDPASMADVARSILEDPAQYRRLSETTADALDAVSCPTAWGDLIDQWKQSFANDKA